MEINGVATPNRPLDKVFGNIPAQSPDLCHNLVGNCLYSPWKTHFFQAGQKCPDARRPQLFSPAGQAGNPEERGVLQRTLQRRRMRGTPQMPACRQAGAFFNSLHRIIPCTSAPVPRGSLSPRCPNADTPAERSDCDRRRDSLPGRSS